MTEVWFKQAQFGSDVVVYAEKIVGAVFMPNNKYVAIIGDGGAAVPVEGSLEEVNDKINAAMTAAKTKENK